MPRRTHPRSARAVYRADDAPALRRGRIFRDLPLNVREAAPGATGNGLYQSTGPVRAPGAGCATDGA